MPFLDQLRDRLGKEWPSLMAARHDAQVTRSELSGVLAVGKDRLDPADASIVVFGSLAREEWTSGSDLDWTLLIDGQVDPEHQRTAFEIATRLRAKYKKPGLTGVFGNMAFSHPIIHQIGGQDDTNRNTTQRILLLLESVPIGDPAAHDRVLRAILQRYLEDDESFVNSEGVTGNSVPRFLLNDIVRFWRTVAVDFAAKQRERGGEGWGLRTAKLRMSRKLIFAAGLIACFECHLHRPSDLDQVLRSSERLSRWQDFLRERFRATPLEIVANFLYGWNSPSACTLMDSYDSFLAILRDEDKRQHLEKLRPEDRRRSSVFREVRDLGHSFQDALTKVFFEESHVVGNLVRRYGVF